MCDEFNLEKNKSQISLLVEEVVKSEDFERIVQGVLPSIVHIVKNQGEMINVDGNNLTLFLSYYSTN